MPIRPENKARYPKDWPVRSYFVRFIRAKGRCEWCGAEHGRPHPVTGSKVVLTTAHVYDKSPEACSLLNLAALCQKCHLGHDAEDRRRHPAQLTMDELLQLKRASQERDRRISAAGMVRDEFLLVKPERLRGAKVKWPK